MTVSWYRAFMANHPHLRAEGGINWQWVLGFETETEAREFITIVETMGCEHRGVYPSNGKFDVRWRE